MRLTHRPGEDFLTGRPRQEAERQPGAGLLFWILRLLGIMAWPIPAIALGLTLLHDVEKRQFASTWNFGVWIEKAIPMGWSAFHIEKMLERQGIEIVATADTWPFGNYNITVALEDAAEAEYWLNRHGIPITDRSRGAPVV